MATATKTKPAKSKGKVEKATVTEFLTQEDIKGLQSGKTRVIATKELEVLENRTRVLNRLAEARDQYKNLVSFAQAANNIMAEERVKIVPFGRKEWGWGYLAISLTVIETFMAVLTRLI